MYGLVTVSAVDVGIVVGIALAAAAGGYVAGYWQRMMESIHEFV
jgi:hypothetical protein